MQCVGVYKGPVADDIARLGAEPDEGVKAAAVQALAAHFQTCGWTLLHQYQHPLAFCVEHPLFGGVWLRETSGELTLYIRPPADQPMKRVSFAVAFVLTLFLESLSREAYCGGGHELPEPESPVDIDLPPSPPPSPPPLPTPVPADPPAPPLSRVAADPPAPPPSLAAADPSPPPPASAPLNAWPHRPHMWGAREPTRCILS